jgi:hypothetical protein
LQIRAGSRFGADLQAGTGTDWKDAFAKHSASAFAAALAEDVTLEAATLFKPIYGRENVKRVMEAASHIYESLIFTESTADGRRQCLEWTPGRSVVSSSTA